MHIFGLWEKTEYPESDPSWWIETQDLLAGSHRCYFAAVSHKEELVKRGKSPPSIFTPHTFLFLGLLCIINLKKDIKAVNQNSIKASLACGQL